MVEQMKTVVSGGQTGIDQLGLEVAKSLGLVTGGWAPKDFKTEKGNQPELARLYGLRDCGVEGYEYRTQSNVLEAELTVIFGDVDSPGSRLTYKLCDKHNKLCLRNPTITSLVQCLLDNQVQTLNVAGNRASKLTPARLELARTVLTAALAKWKES